MDVYSSTISCGRVRIDGQRSSSRNSSGISASSSQHIERDAVILTTVEKGNMRNSNSNDNADVIINDVIEGNNDVDIKVMGSSSSNNNNTATTTTPRVKTEVEDVKYKSCCICFMDLDANSDEYRLHLLRHLEQYEGKSICPSCKKDCGASEKMVDHFLIIHGQVDRLVCPAKNCVRSFRTKKALRIHNGKHE